MLLSPPCPIACVCMCVFVCVCVCVCVCVRVRVCVQVEELEAMSVEFDKVEHQVVEETKEVESLLQQLADSDAQLCELQAQLGRSLAGVSKPTGGPTLDTSRGTGSQRPPGVSVSTDGGFSSGFSSGFNSVEGSRLPSPGPLYPFYSSSEEV
jgi:hypothetical protein